MSPSEQGFASTTSDEILDMLAEVSGPNRRWVTTQRLVTRFEAKRGVPSNEGSLAGRLKDLAERGSIQAQRGMAGERKWRPQVVARDRPAS